MTYGILVGIALFGAFITILNQDYDGILAEVSFRRTITRFVGSGMFIISVCALIGLTIEKTLS